MYMQDKSVLIDGAWRRQNSIIIGIDWVVNLCIVGYVFGYFAGKIDVEASGHTFLLSAAVGS